MGFEAGSKDFDNIFNFLNAQSGSAAKFLEALSKYLDGKNNIAGAKMMSKWIKDGNGVCGYSARADCVELLAHELNERAIPHVRMRQPNGLDVFLIRDCDKERVQSINKEVLTIRGNYYQQVSIEELEDALAAATQLDKKDRMIASIDGLTDIQAEVLKGKCANMGEGFTVAIEKLSNGTNRLSCQASKVVTPNMQREDMGKAFNEMALSLYGPNAEIRKEQAKADMQFNKDVFEYDVANGDGFIIGADNKNCMLEIDENGFKYKKVTVKDGLMNEDTICEVSSGQPDYKEQLQSYMCKIQDKVFTYDRATVDQHFLTGGESTKSKRPVKNEMEQKISDGESELAKKIDEMIKASDTYKSVQEKSPTEQFNLYQKETVKIMSSLIDDTAPDGYTYEELVDLKKVVEEHGMDMSAYTEAIHAIDACEMKERLAVEKTKTLDEQLKELSSDKSKSHSRAKEPERE